MEAIHCMFGEDCPCHGRNCGCDMGWALLEERQSLDWGIEVLLNGTLRYYVFDADFEEYYMCPTHFLAVWRLTEEDIFQMIASQDRKIRLSPEE